MYNNNYSVTWSLKSAKKRVFTQADKQIFYTSISEFNSFFLTADCKTTYNKKYIRGVNFTSNHVKICFETEHPLPDAKRRGNALRQFSRILAKNGMQIYVSEQRLMRAA